MLGEGVFMVRPWLGYIFHYITKVLRLMCREGEAVAEGDETTAEHFTRYV